MINVTIIVKYEYNVWWECKRCPESVLTSCHCQSELGTGQFGSFRFFDMVLKKRFDADGVWSYVTYLSISREWFRPRHPCLVVPLCHRGTMAHVTEHLGHSSLRQSLFGDGRSCLPILCDCWDLVNTTVPAILLQVSLVMTAIGCSWGSY